MFKRCMCCLKTQRLFSYAQRIGFCQSVAAEKKLWPKRIFSGIQPTGIIHIGNYFGAIESWVNLQNSNNDVIFSIVDFHSITIPKDPRELQSSILSMAACLLGCGIDPTKAILFQQSKVSEHTQLCWVLGSLTTMARLYHFPQYKEKSAGLKDIPLGLFTYPVLQSADILLYKATDVPVGEDQVQHLHLTQHLVNTFNNKYGATFPFPQYSVNRETGAGKIRDLRDPTKKMSKSSSDSKSRINITDPPDEIIKKVKKAVTDFKSEVTYDPEERPGVSNLLVLHSLVTGKTYEEICEECALLNTGQYKLVVAEELISKFSPIRAEISRLEKSPDYLEDVLEEGAEKARSIAHSTWTEVCNKMGLGSYVKTKRKNIVSV